MSRGLRPSRFLAAALLTASLVPAAAAFLPAPAAAAACAALPTARGTATMAASVPASGTYRVWARTQTPVANTGRFYLQIPDAGMCQTSVGGAKQVAGQLVWIDYSDAKTDALVEVTLAAGSHAVIIAGQDNNVAVDRILLLSDKTCVPAGDGSNCTQGIAASPSPSPAAGAITAGASTPSPAAPAATPENASGVTPQNLTAKLTPIALGLAVVLLLGGGAYIYFRHRHITDFDSPVDAGSAAQFLQLANAPLPVAGAKAAASGPEPSVAAPVTATTPAPATSLVSAATPVSVLAKTTAPAPSSTTAPTSSAAPTAAPQPAPALATQPTEPLQDEPRRLS